MAENAKLRPELKEDLRQFIKGRDRGEAKILAGQDEEPTASKTSLNMSNMTGPTAPIGQNHKEDFNLYDCRI